MRFQCWKQRLVPLELRDAFNYFNSRQVSCRFLLIVVEGASDAAAAAAAAVVIVGLIRAPSSPSPVLFHGYNMRGQLPSFPGVRFNRIFKKISKKLLRKAL